MASETVSTRRPRSVVPVLLTVFGVLAVLVAGVVGAPGAQAHAGLDGSTPAKGASVEVAPARIVLRFDEPVRGARVTVKGPDGEVTRGKPVTKDSTVTQRLAADRPAGRYRVSWRVTSPDGDPVSGTVSFRAERGAVVPSPEPSPVPTPSPADPAPVAVTVSSSPVPSAAAVLDPGSTGTDDGRSARDWIVSAVIFLAGVGGLVVLARRRRARRN